jgi:N-methylhydantoinase B/oxoprolinase/acetone carboxylase alpha subunit
VGGTFTDFVLAGGPGAPVTWAEPSDPADPAGAVPRGIPDGTCRFRAVLDDDAASPLPVRLAVEMTVRDGPIHLDFTETDPAVPSACDATHARSAVPARGLERFFIRPRGMAAGMPGANMRVLRTLGTARAQDLGKPDRVRLDKGDTATVPTPGDGGRAGGVIRSMAGRSGPLPCRLSAPRPPWRPTPRARARLVAFPERL